MPTGITGTPCSTAMYAAPIRKRSIQPSGDRVPSGKTTTFQPSSSRSPGVWLSLPPRRSIGNVLNMIADAVARHQVSKK